MCSYDYTPYTGCEGGPQHYYIQWVKCDAAVERGRYCSLDASQKVEQLRKLSVNILSCPLHGPIAVQQIVLEPANARLPGEERERSRARSAARRGPAPRGRTPRRGPADWEPEEPAARQVRKRRSRREIVGEPTGSEQSDDDASSSRRRVDGRVTRRGHREVTREKRTTRDVQPHGHRRSASADAGTAAPSHPPPDLSMRYGQSEVSLPLKTGSGTEGKEDDQGSTTGRRPTPGILGLPSSPDMHRRDSVHRASSETGLRLRVDGAPEPMPASKSAVSPASDKSPDHNPDLPFSTRERLGRRTGARSIRDRSVDTTMRRIDEDVAQDENAAATQDAPASTIRSLSTTPSSAPQQQGQDARSRRRSNNSRPHLNSLQIPPIPQRESSTSPKYQREAYSAPTATPPETELSPPNPTTRPRRAGSFHHLDLPSPTVAANFQPHVPPPGRSSASSANPHLPPSGAAGDKDKDRGSVDSGYLSGGGLQHQHPHPRPHPRPHEQLQASPHYIPPDQLWNRPDLPRATGASSGKSDTRSASPTEASPSAGRPQGSSPSQQSQQQQQQQQSAQGQGQGQGAAGLVQTAGGQQQQQQEQQEQQQQKQKQKQKHNNTRPVPPPLNLASSSSSGSGTAMQASQSASASASASPGTRSPASADGAASVGKGAKTKLLQRMGLRRKFSGLLGRDRDRAGQRSEVGVES
ncbi:hypothetical protein VTH06DRAFT_5299 [Thermothelomyces fergusii]